MTVPEGTGMIQSTRERLQTTLKNHRRALETSSWLTDLFRRQKKQMCVGIGPREVIAALADGGVKCVLMGTHALNTWRSQPRATQDVDILVRSRVARRAVESLRSNFPDLVLSDSPSLA